MDAVGSCLEQMTVRDAEGRGVFGELGQGHQSKLLHIAKRGTLVICDELEAQGADNSTIKARIDGKPLALSGKGTGEELVAPRWSIWGTANDYVRGSVDPGVSRRIITIQTEPNSMPQEWWSSTVAEIHAELPYLLAWLLDEAVKSQRKLPAMPAALDEAQKDVARDSDPLGGFFEAHCQKSSDQTTGIRTREILEAVKAETGITVTAKGITTRLMQAGFTRHQNGGMSLWHLTLSPEAEKLAQLGGIFGHKPF